MSIFVAENINYISGLLFIWSIGLILNYWINQNGKIGDKLEKQGFFGGYTSQQAKKDKMVLFLVVIALLVSHTYSDLMFVQKVEIQNYEAYSSYESALKKAASVSKNKKDEIVLVSTTSDKKEVEPLLDKPLELKNKKLPDELFILDTSQKYKNIYQGKTSIVEIGEGTKVKNIKVTYKASKTIFEDLKEEIIINKYLEDPNMQSKKDFLVNYEEKH